MRGTIDQIWENENRNGQKYLTVQINGERYSVWDTEYFDLIQEGAGIEYDVRQSGNFKHLVDIRQFDEQHAPVYQPNHRDKQITRLSGQTMSFLASSRRCGLSSLLTVHESDIGRVAISPLFEATMTLPSPRIRAITASEPNRLAIIRS